MWGVEDAPAHLVMATGLEHQSLADPVEFPHEVQPFLLHAVSGKRRASLRHYPNGIAGRMPIDAFKDMSSHLMPQGLKQALTTCTALSLISWCGCG